MTNWRVCPICEKETLHVFQKTPTLGTLICKECKNTFTVKTSRGIVLETILAWFSILTGIIAILAFTGIKCIDDLKKL